MRIVVLGACIFVASVSARPSLAQCCRCRGCGGSASPVVPQDRPFWDARSGRYLFHASGTRTWYYWLPEERQWAAVPALPPGPIPGAPTGIPPQIAAPAATDQHQHSHDTQLAPAPAAGTQALYGGQRTCPVMDEELGAHGPPIPVTVRGQTLYVCCRGCVRRVLADQDTYLAKVAEERARLHAGPNGR